MLETFIFSRTIKTRQSSCQRHHPVLYYGTCIRPVLEYASAVFHYSLPKYLSEDMERIQERAHSIIYSLLKYEDSLLESGLVTLHDRRKRVGLRVVKKNISENVFLRKLY